MVKSTLSICIVSYNVVKHLKDCLSSIAAYKSDTLDIQTIVVDNASPDASADTVRNEFPGIHLIALEKNAGFAAANNIGLSHATGDYIMLLNPDTIVRKGSLDTLVGYLKEHPECGIVGPKLLNEDMSIQNGLRKFPSAGVVFIRNTPLKHFKFFKKHIRKYHMRDYNLSESGEVEQVSGAAFMFTRETFVKLGPLDEQFFIYFEEVDYCKRAHQAGLKVFYLSNSEIIHLGGKSSHPLNFKINYIHMVSQLKYLKKYMLPFKYVIFSILFKVFYLMTTLINLFTDLLLLPCILILFLFRPGFCKQSRFQKRKQNFFYRLYFLSHQLFNFLSL